ncbi:MAG: hypothetical protein ACD_54C00073G0001, partial [uncultured bacterium]
MTAEVGAAAQVLARISRHDLAAQEMLAFTWATPEGVRSGDVFAPRPYKHYDLQDAKIDLQATDKAGVFEITLSAQALALFVALEADQPGRFSNNAFALFPGYPATLRFTPTTPGVAPHFTIRDLHSATYGAA